MDSKTHLPNRNLFTTLAFVLPICTPFIGVAGPNDPHDSTNAAPTYLRDVRPIVMRRCSRCHNEQARFVYNWLDYSTAHQDRGEIARRVWDSWKGSYFKESMPIDNSPESLAITPEERAEIRNWVKAGAPKGVPPPPNAPK